MQDITILLKKYADNTCTPEERAEVERWMAAPASPEPALWPAGEDEQEVREALWQHIRQATTGRSRAIRRKLLYIPAAACLLLALALIWQHNPMLLSRKLILRNGSSGVTQIFNIEELQLSLAPDSRCTLQVPLFGHHGDQVSLCGAVAVVNNSGHPVSLQVSSEAGSCTASAGSDEVTLRKGQTYLVMTDKDYNLIAATREELLDGLPRLFSSRLTERFKL
ncbi:hypothetical protein ECE50_005445 [Chitinophaga sp. Mgbs1]|uniref:Uncharacterized protein n=1 Tax=Chitinophaga solisilvae TaxID=1233460 RepID=A0A3S1CMT8_9BACT|nr:hypothetical protein [Chitinophaga solisilvae]